MQRLRVTAILAAILVCAVTVARAPANWEAEEDTWTVPINLILSKLSSFGVFPASHQLGVGGFAAHPEIGPSWKIRGAIVILLPRRQ